MDDEEYSLENWSPENKCEVIVSLFEQSDRSIDFLVQAHRATMEFLEVVCVRLKAFWKDDCISESLVEYSNRELFSFLKDLNEKSEYKYTPLLDDNRILNRIKSCTETIREKEVLKQKMLSVCEFFIEFYDIYNAIKHGYRYKEFTPSDGEHEYIIFVTKDGNNEVVRQDFLKQKSYYIIQEALDIARVLKDETVEISEYEEPEITNEITLS